MPSAQVFVAEHVPRRRSASPVHADRRADGEALLLGSVVATINTTLSPQSIAGGGWRIPFLLGGMFGWWRVPAPLAAGNAVFIGCRRVSAGRAAAEIGGAQPQAGSGGIVLLTRLLSAGIVVVILMTPDLSAKQFGIAPALTLQASSIATIMLIAGCIVLRFVGRSLRRQQNAGGRQCAAGQLQLAVP